MATSFSNPREPWRRASQTVAIPPRANAHKSSYRPSIAPGSKGSGDDREPSIESLSDRRQGPQGRNPRSPRMAGALPTAAVVGDACSKPERAELFVQPFARDPE